MRVLWWFLVTWIEEGRKAAARVGTFIEPSEVIVSLPFWLLIVAYYLAGSIVGRLERYWSKRDG